jgi:hypothetical protein
VLYIYIYIHNEIHGMEAKDRSTTNSLRKKDEAHCLI